MVLSLREITNTKPQNEHSSSNNNWRGRDSSVKATWDSFSSCEKGSRRDSKDSPPEKKCGTRTTPRTSPLRTSKTAYVPPHLRTKRGKREEQRARLMSTPKSTCPSKKTNPSSCPQKTKSRSPSHSPTVLVCGPLLGVAVEVFEKAHGLNGRQKEELEKLKVETMTKYNCSERAFQSLVLGHSYDEVLAPLRRQVSGYVTKEEARKKRLELRKKARKARETAKSCQSSPSTIKPISPSYVERLGGEDVSMLVLNNPFEIPSGLFTPDMSDYFSDSSTGGTPPPERLKNRRRKPRSHTEPALDTSRLSMAFEKAGLSMDGSPRDKDWRVLSDEKEPATIFDNVSNILLSALSTSG